MEFQTDLSKAVSDLSFPDDVCIDSAIGLKFKNVFDQPVILPSLKNRLRRKPCFIIKSYQSCNI